MGLKIITNPSSELITADEAAEFMRAEFASHELTTIQTMITAARQWCEEYLCRVIGIQTLEAVLDDFPRVGSQAIILRPPVISLASVKYFDSNGVEQTMPGADYLATIDSEPGEVRPLGFWPCTQARAGSVRVRYQAGYQNDDSPLLSKVLPATIRTAILMQTADLYSNRESQVERPLSANLTLERLLSPYRLEMGI